MQVENETTRKRVRVDVIVIFCLFINIGITFSLSRATYNFLEPK